MLLRAYQLGRCVPVPVADGFEKPVDQVPEGRRYVRQGLAFMLAGHRDHIHEDIPQRRKADPECALHLGQWDALPRTSGTGSERPSQIDAVGGAQGVDDGLQVRRYRAGEVLPETMADSIRYTAICCRISIVTRRPRSGRRNSAFRSRWSGTAVRLPPCRSGTTARCATGSGSAMCASRDRRPGTSSATASSQPGLAADPGGMLAVTSPR